MKILRNIFRKIKYNLKFLNKNTTLKLNYTVNSSSNSSISLRNFCNSFSFNLILFSYFFSNDSFCSINLSNWLISFSSFSSRDFAVKYLRHANLRFNSGNNASCCLYYKKRKQKLFYRDCIGVYAYFYY